MTTMDKEAFTGEKLKFLRKKYGFTQKELAEKLETYREMITRWETKGGISRVYQRVLRDFFKEIENDL